MEGVRREHLGSAYMVEPRRSHMDTAEEMEVAAVGVPGGRRWEPRGRRSWSHGLSSVISASMLHDIAKHINVYGAGLCTRRVLSFRQTLSVSIFLLAFFRHAWTAIAPRLNCRKPRRMAPPFFFLKYTVYSSTVC